MTTEQPHYAGHRERLRARFLQSGLEGLADYEAIELLLTLAIPRRDVKPLAKTLLQRFGSIRGLLDAPSEELAGIAGVGTSVVVMIRLVRELAEVYLRQAVEGREFVGSPELMARLWRARMSRLRHEVFEVAYLDSGGRLMRDGIETVEEGSIGYAAVYPRRINEAALRRGAARMVFAHNHPGGTPTPSEEDKTITRKLAQAASAVEIQVLDHLIVAGNEVFSFRLQGLL